jgi:hypothetical protein
MYHILVAMANWANQEATPHVSPEYAAALRVLVAAIRNVLKFH